MPTKPAASASPTPRPRNIFGIPAGRRSLSCAEAGELFEVSAQHMKNLCDDGAILAEPIVGRKASSVNYWRIPVAALLDFIRRRTIVPKAAEPLQRSRKTKK